MTCKLSTVSYSLSTAKCAFVKIDLKMLESLKNSKTRTSIPSIFQKVSKWRCFFEKIKRFFYFETKTLLDVNASLEVLKTRIKEIDIFDKAWDTQQNTNKLFHKKLSAQIKIPGKGYELPLESNFEHNLTGPDSSQMPVIIFDYIKKLELGHRSNDDVLSCIQNSIEDLKKWNSDLNDEHPIHGDIRFNINDRKFVVHIEKNRATFKTNPQEIQVPNPWYWTDYYDSKDF